MSYNDCSRCFNHSKDYSSSAKIYTNMKPSIDYKIENWLPSKVKMLFIAEAPQYHPQKKGPATDSYFYNPLESQRIFGVPEPLLGTLSFNIFSLLHIDENISKLEKLNQFKKLGCYFVEVIKCRADRSSNKIIMNKTVKNCSYYLQKELEEIKFSNITIMGERALFGIKNCSMFSDIIPDMNLLQLIEQMRFKPLNLTNCKLFLIPLPLWHNRTYINTINTTFNNIRKELGIN